MKNRDCKTIEEAELYSEELFNKYKQPVIMGVDYWNNSQLSIVKYSGKMVLNNVHYMIDYDTLDLVMTEFHPTYVKFYKENRPHYDPKTGERIENEKS